jgi:hypothetical protein
MRAALQGGKCSSTTLLEVAVMGCEFKSTESYTGTDKLLHTKLICTGNLLGCLVDTPMGYMGCTRRTWLLLQGATTDNRPTPKSRRLRVSELQGKLV